MLGLKLPTDPRWVNIVEKNIEEILTDHAYCEQKAASTAISLIVSFPEKSDLVEAMTALVKEEISHFKMVHDKILARGWTLGRERKDEYVIKLIKFFPKGGSRETHLIHRLLYAALIEARSCERFRLLSENINDKELARFYRKLMVSEANHYTMFLNFARKYGDREEVDKKWQQLLEYEATLMKNLGKKRNHARIIDIKTCLQQLFSGRFPDPDIPDSYRAGAGLSLLAFPLKRCNNYKNPSLWEGGYAIGVLGWEKSSNTRSIPNADHIIW